MKKKSAQRKAAEAVGIDEDDWDGTVESTLAAESLSRATYGIEGRDPSALLQAVALVIQNYEGTRELKNTLSDAQAVAAKLEGMGFVVMSLMDENTEGGKVDQLQMEDIIEDFIEKVDENTIAAFAFMGASRRRARSPCLHISRVSVCVCVCVRALSTAELVVSSLQGMARSRQTTQAQRSTT